MVSENPYQSPLETCEQLGDAEFDSFDRSFVWLLFSSKGRIPRRPFWTVTVGLHLLVAASCLLLDRLPDAAFILWFPSMVLCGWCFYAVQAKRWHDRNKSILWTAIIFIPGIGPMWEVIELGSFRGTEGPNRYGPDPTEDIRGQSINQLRDTRSIRGRVIELDGTDTTDADLARLADGWNIEELRLGGTRVTDDGMKIIGELSNLKLLDLSLTTVGDAGLECLLNLTHLAELWLGGTKVTDAGLLKLSVIPQLENVYAINTDITNEGVKELQLRLPECKVHY